jgi:hypothetical protein
MFRPVVDGGGWMPDSGALGGFSDGNTHRLKDWVDCLTCAPMDHLLDYMIIQDWKPTDAYAKTRRWFVVSGRVDSIGSGTASFQQLIRKESVLYIETRRRQPWTVVTVEEMKGEEIHSWYPTGVGEPRSGSINEEAWIELAADHMLLTETGVRKEFKDCEDGDWVFHCTDGSSLGAVPTARVFDGGMWCSACKVTYTGNESSPWEEPYPFLTEEMEMSSNSQAYMPELDWDKLLSKKWVVIEAPMGSGKTYQLETLLLSLDERFTNDGYSVLVISFRRLLSQQQAKRLGITCYLDLDREQMREGPRQLTLCLNSVALLPPRVSYDYVIFDECGLIRRHFLGTTMTNCTREAYQRLVSLQQKAKNVILLQDGITLEDVQFFAEADEWDCESRDKVSAYCFAKPVEIHPIVYTNDHEAAIGNMLTKYRGSFQRNKDGVVECCDPFMVFCSNASMCESLVRALKLVAIEVEGADPDRVQGVWASMRLVNPFFKRFAGDPNKSAKDADVVVCSSTIGAGFSVNTHFTRFFAFLYTNILNFDEEKQFIQRLRFSCGFAPRTHCVKVISMCRSRGEIRMITRRCKPCLRRRGSCC